MKKIKVLFEDDSHIYIMWDKSQDAIKYLIMGLNDCFNYEKIYQTTSNKIRIPKEKVRKFLNIKIFYIFRDSFSNKDQIIDTTDTLTITDDHHNGGKELIKIRSIESYDGITLSFSSRKIYDKYHLYQYQDNQFVFIAETEDFQVTSDKFKIGVTYYVEGFMKEDDEYKLSAASKPTICDNIKIDNSKKLLSIVVPVYNAKKFVSRCIDSILLSTFNDIELLLIDDGSTDGSSEIIDWYEEKYGDIVKVVHQKNKGQSSARNRGIELATCEYIAFVDNDDIVHSFMYEDLYSIAITHNLDIVIGKVIIRDDLDIFRISLDVRTDRDYLIYSYDKMFREKESLTRDNIFFVAVWNKIIKTSLAKKHRFPSDHYYEDTAFTNMIYSYVDNFGFAPNAFYVWDRRIRKTVGTFSTIGYRNPDKDKLFLHKKSVDAIFYAVRNGNKIRMNYLIYSAIKEVYSFMEKSNILNSDSDVGNIYKKKIISTHRTYNILNNTYIKSDKKMYKYLVSILQNSGDL